MKQFNPFPKCTGMYGAPMGRHNNNIDIDAKRFCARPQGGGDGYDRGGAYWGTPSNVWAVWVRGKSSEGCVYVRANSREAAIKEAQKC